MSQSMPTSSGQAGASTPVVHAKLRVPSDPANFTMDDRNGVD